MTEKKRVKFFILFEKILQYLTKIVCTLINGLK